MPIYLSILYPTTALAVVLIGFFVLFQDRFSTTNRSFFALTFFQVFWITSLFLGYRFTYEAPVDLVKSELFIQFAYAAGPIMMLCLIIFLYFFPRITIRFGKIWSWSYIALMITIALLSAFTELVHDDQIIVEGRYITDSFGPLYNFYSLLLLLSLLLATYIATKKAFALKGLEKRKIMFATVGCWLYGFTTIITNIILPLLGLTWIGNVSVAEISPVYILFFLVPTFYSIYKHRFFNFSYLSFHVFRTVIFDVIFLFSTLALFLLVTLLAPVLNMYAKIGISALAAFMIIQEIQPKLPEFLPEGLRALKKAIAELEATLLSCESFEDLQYTVENAFVVELNFVSAKLYVCMDSSNNSSLPVYQKDSFTKILREYRKDAFVRGELEFNNLNEESKKKLVLAMNSLDADLFIPLSSEGNLIGFLALKKGGADIVYAKEEIAEYLNMKRRLEVSLMNILLKLNLEEENNLMKQIINKKTKQLKAKIEQVNELLKQQADFIAVTAHEFRTPLTIATFQIDALMHSKKPAAQKIKDLSLVDDAINNLKTLTEKLFAVQQYDLKKVSLKLESVDLTAFIDRLFSDFKPIMKKKGLRFELKKGMKKKVMTKIDQAQFRQVLHNLLTNASKFTPKSGLVQVETNLNKTVIEISINDSGDGIPDDMKKTIFEKFRTKHAGAGIGLGLYLCKKIIALHKGKLWVEDSKLGGASFRISMKKTS